jgi:hypothetical protein
MPGAQRREGLSRFGRPGASQELRVEIRPCKRGQLADSEGIGPGGTTNSIVHVP